MKKIELNRHKWKIFNICVILVFYITIVIFRVIYWVNPSVFASAFPPDSDYLLRVDEIANGLFNLYGDVYSKETLCHYLYYWFFYFYPLTLLPSIIGFFIWDALRLVTFVYIILNIDKYIKNDKNFLIWEGITFTAFYFDQYLNNTNFLIFFFLFMSYKMLLEDKKVFASIFFFLAVFKINAMLYLVVILVNKRISIKELIVYYIAPFAVIMIPYIIFPDYLFQWLSNLGFFYSEIPEEPSLFNIFRTLVIILWKLFQFAQWMFYGFIFAIFIEDQKKERQTSLILVLALFFLVLLVVMVITILFFPLF
jgi:hypothetical protein